MRPARLPLIGRVFCRVRPGGRRAGAGARAERHHAPDGEHLDQRAPRWRPGRRCRCRSPSRPKRSMHVYAPGKHDYQVIAVKLDPQPWMKAAPTTYPPSEIYHFKELDEKVETYGKPFTLVQDVTVLTTPEAKKALAAVADQVERPPRVPGVRRQGLLRADEGAGQLRPHGEMIRPPSRAGAMRGADAGAGRARSLPIRLAARRHHRRAAARRRKVAEYFARAQSIMCLERVSLQRLGMGFGADGPARRVESELRLSWEPSADDRRRPKRAPCGRSCVSTDRRRARRTTRTARRRSSRTRKSSRCRCCCRASARSTPSRYSGRDVVDRRDAIVVAYREISKPTVDVSLIEDNEDCISFDIEGGMRGRIWIDAETHDVLRLDRSLSGLIEIPLPRKVTRRGRLSLSWTMERWDSSIRFKRVTFQDPEETLVLPVESTRRCRSPAAPARRAFGPPLSTCRTAGS